MCCSELLNFTGWRLLNESRERLTKKQNFKNSFPFVSFSIYVRIKHYKFDPTDDKTYVYLQQYLNELYASLLKATLHHIPWLPAINAEQGR